MSSDLPATLALLPFFVSGRFPKAELIGRCRPGVVSYTSGRELVEIVRDVSLGLGSLGMRRGDRVALVAESRPEWLFADLAVLAAGAVTVPAYPTLPAEQIEFILRDSEATLAVVSTPLQLAKVQSVAARVPTLRAIVAMEEPADPAGRVPVVSLAAASTRGHRRILDAWGQAKAFHDEAKQVRPDDLATIIYTSGTTGQPKGVILTHQNLMANVAGVKAVLHVDEADSALSFLPLCHAFERLVAYFYLASGCSIAFAESFDTIARDLGAVRPTIMTGVPRLFEKLQTRVLETGRAATGLKRAVFTWAVRAAERHGAAKEDGRSLSGWQRLETLLADRLVFRQVRNSVGGRMRFAVSGSAPLQPSIGRFFYGMGIPILEGYGLTEASPVLAVMPLERIRFGTVGPALPNVELRVAEDGEILARGPNVMAGYLNHSEDTAAALSGGWLHTGDVGSRDADGYLRITDRKKELIVTSGGKKIAPQPIEAALKANPLVAEAALVGDRRKFAAALLVPNFDVLASRLRIATPADPSAAAALVGRPDVRVLYQEIVDRVNVPLAQFERIKQFAILSRWFSIESGELTPTLKLKRRVIERNYQDTIDRLYGT